MVSSAVLQHSRSAATTVVIGQVDAAALRVVCEAVEHLLEIGETAVGGDLPGRGEWHRQVIHIT